MFFSIYFVTLWTFVLTRSTSPKLGVDITETGTIKVAVDGPLLQYSDEKCTGQYFIYYATTDPDTPTPGVCLLGGSKGPGTASCSLKRDSEGLVEVEAKTLPTGCVVTFTNAFFPTKDDESGGSVPIAAIVASSVIGSVLVLLGLALLGYFVIWPCYKRQRATSRTTHAADALPTPPASAIPSSTTLGKKRSTTEQTTNNPMPSSSNAL